MKSVAKTVKKTLNEFNVFGVQFIVLHELMHNYYTNVKHAAPIKTPGDNVLSDKKINKDIAFRWSEFKDIIP